VSQPKLQQDDKLKNKLIKKKELKSPP